MQDGADEEGEGGGEALGEVGHGGAVDVAAEEVVHGYVPLAGELEPGLGELAGGDGGFRVWDGGCLPVARVPPVGVKVPVSEARNLGKSAEHVLEDDEKDEQKRDHERKQQHANSLCQDKPPIRPPSHALEPSSAIVEHGHDELLARNGHEKYAAKDGERLPEELHPLGARGARVLELVAEGGAEDVVGVVGEGEVLGVGDGAEGGGELEG